MISLAIVTVALFLIAALASAKKSPPRKALEAPCDVPCLEAKNAALQKLAVKRLKGWQAMERKRNQWKTRAKRLEERVGHSSRDLGRSGNTERSSSIPHYSAWLCIHSHEGAWNDSGDPYWGGLQMDRSFMSTYAPAWLLRRGLANLWTPLQQMWVAERAWRTRGFSPWPNTARTCGLL